MNDNLIKVYVSRNEGQNKIMQSPKTNKQNPPNPTETELEVLRASLFNCCINSVAQNF